MADFPPPGLPGAPTTGAPTSGPAPGWWQASDGNWYPPEQQPGYAPPGSGPPGHGGPSAYGYGYQFQPARSTNGWAIASLVVSLVSCGIGSILGVVFGHVAMSQIKRTGDGGRGLAIAGLIIGYLGLALLILFVIAIFALGDDASNRFEPIDDQLGLAA